MRRSRNLVVCFVSAVLLALVSHGAAAGETILYSFKGGRDGADPNSRLVTDSEGNLYGATGTGGIRDMGTVFKLTNRKKTVIYLFKGGSDGGAPRGDLFNAGGTKSGITLLGTTAVGGDKNLGTVFQVTSDGEETVLYSFTGGHDGATPMGGVVMDQAGNLYGTTSAGGDFSFGTVFELTGHRLKVLYTFTNEDGASPQSGLIIDSKGDLVGTTQIGGPKAGTIFMLTAKDRKLRRLHSFLPSRDGADPTGALIEDSDGNFYGTAFEEGPGRAGTVFRLALRPRKFDLVFTFTDNRFGANPVGGLTGGFCGVTNLGGAGGGGTVFQLTPDKGTATLLHSFGGAGDGFAPIAGLLADDSGGLFGTTSRGGDFDSGTVFKVTGCSAR